MQVVSPYYVNSPSFISTIHLTDSSLLLSSSFANISNKHKNVVNDIAVLNNETFYKTTLSSHACTPISNFQQWFDTCLYKSAFQKSCNDFMNDDNTMAATNSKRYLQNKLGDRKRRRPDSVLLETSEMEVNDTSTRSRQATRQLVKNNLKPATTTLEKSNKTEKSILSISASKKQLRSSGNHNIEQFCDYKKLPDRSSPTNCHEKEGVDELLSNKSDIHSTTYQRANYNLKNYINKLENQKKFDIEEDRNSHNHYMEQEVSDEDETKKNNDSNSSSIILSEKSLKKMYQTNAASVNDNTATLDYENMNSRNNAYSPSSSGLISETHCTTAKLNCILEEKSLLDDVNNIKEVTHTPVGENDSSMSPCPPLDRVNDDNKTQEDYENHLSRTSNSLCSDNSFSSNSCCKDSIDNSDNRTQNESKTDLKDTNQTKSTNLSINQLQMISINSQKENNMASTQEDKYCKNLDGNDDKNAECAIKSQSVYNMTMQANDVSNSYLSKTIKSAKLEKINFGQKVNDADLVIDTIEYSKEDSDNKQEKKDNRPACLEKSLIREGSNSNTRQIDDEYKGSQQLTAEKISNHQQLEDNIINATDKLYTEIEYNTNNRQQNIASISSRYGQLINNNQQTSQQDRDCDAHHQSHDIRLSHQQDPQQQQHSIHQQQQPYANVHLYQLQQQQEHHQQLPIEHHHQTHNEIKLQQHHHNISQDTQREMRPQEHAHLMEFLQPQHHHSSTNMQSPIHQQQQLQPHQHQIHEVYHELMMDEFHDDHRTPYKLGLSPSTVKHENQDDGYETSAGDVLTPISHTSSTHSVTPQQHLHHVTSGSGFTPNVTKSGEEQHHQQQQHNIHLQQSQHNCNLINEQTMQQELTQNESARNLTPRDTYHFIDDDLNSPNNNNSLHNILTPPHSHSHSQSRAVNQEARTLNDFLGMQSEVHSNILNSASEMYGLTNSAVNHLSQKQVGAETILTTATITNSNHQQQHFLDIESEMVATHDQDSILNLQTKSIQKKRGRKKKITPGETLSILERTSLNDLDTAAKYLRAKERKKHDRFNGMSEEEIVKRILPDHLCENLDIVIIGINPGLFAAYKGHHYAGPGNHFWKCLYLSGLTQEQMSADEDFKLIKYGIGFTNMVQRATKGSADLTRKEIKEGSRILLEKLQRFRPKIAVFNGKLIFEVFSGKKDFNFGRQPECVEGTDTFIWVMPSSSARCAQLPRAAHKVPFYAALKKFRDYLNGLVPHIEQSECVFTEESIKQQYEQQNYKNQQNNISGEASDNFSNTVGICNTDKLLQSNTIDSESNPHGAGRGPDPSQSSTVDSTANTSFMMSSLVGPHEKKKRGRPKKIKEQEVVDPVTGNKIQGNNQILTPGNVEFNSILNLSVAQVPNSEVPKKKRGRPKKLKLPTNTLPKIIVHSSSILSQTPNILSIHSMTSDVIQSSPHHIQGIQQSHQQTSIYSTPPHQHQRNIYSPMVSPMASPSLNCSYTTNTPPSNQNHDKLVLNGNEKESSETTREVLVTTQHSINEQNFCKSPPAPNSPNICAVDFNPSTAVSTATSSSLIISDNVNTDLNTMHHQRLQNCQKPRFNSQNSSEATPDHNSNTEHFQQWLSPQHNHGVPTPAAAALVSNTMYSNLPQHASLNYHDQQQVQVIQQQQHQQEIHTQWALRHQSRYDDSPYLLSSSEHQTQPHSHENIHQQQQNHCGSDVARKSLSGLESLVDQIPAISESESIALSSASAVNAQVAAAAAVENRLQSMQNSSHNDTQIGDDSHFPTITGSSNPLTVSSSPTSATSTNNPMQQSNTSTSLVNNNFSVRNLAASSASSNSIGNNNNQENYGISSNSRPLSNTNAYHHTNIMAAAVLAAAAANSPTNLSTPAESSTATHHAQMYMDPHAHLTTHVPINTIYPATAAATHHHHSAVASAHHHHTAAVHYNSVSHAPTEYTTNNIYTSPQSNVAAGHTLHMPSPNYPYGYSTASSQSNYTTYPHTHANHHHGHPHAHHTAHHLGMFDRLKPSDITGYSSGF